MPKSTSFSTLNVINSWKHEDINGRLVTDKCTFAVSSSGNDAKTEIVDKDLGDKITSRMTHGWE